MRTLLLLPFALLLAGGSACYGPPTPATPPPDQQPRPVTLPEPVDPLLNPAGRRVVDTTIPRTSRPYVPLSESLELRYDELEFRGAGDRVLFMTDRPPGARVRGQWRFVITGVEQGVEPPVYTAEFTRTTPPKDSLEEEDDASPITERLRLWVDGDRVRVAGPWGERDAVEIEPGPPVVGSEEVGCTLWMLGGVHTTCRAVGGVGGNEIGAADIFLDLKNDVGHAVARTVVGIFTLGTMIPASKRRSWRLDRTMSAGVTPERPVPALFRAWTQAPPSGDGVAQLQELATTHPPDAASLAAIVASQRAHVEARAAAAMGLLPAHHRAPVIREAFRALPDDAIRDQILLLGRLNAAIASVPASHRESIEELVEGPVLDSGRRLAAGDCPSFGKALREPESVPWSEAVRVNMAGDLAQPACDEAALGVPHASSSYDAVLDLILAAQSDERWATRLRAALERDEDPLRLLDRHLERARARPVAEREALLLAFQGDHNEDTVRTKLGL